MKLLIALYSPVLEETEILELFPFYYDKLTKLAKLTLNYACVPFNLSHKVEYIHQKQGMSTPFSFIMNAV